MNLVGNLFWPGYDVSSWWINLGRCPMWLANLLFSLSAAILLGFAFRPPLSRPGRSIPTLLIAVFLACVELINSVGFYRLLAEGRVAAGFPVPLSLLICSGMLWVAYAAWFPGENPIRVRRWKIALGGLLLFGAFPLALMLFFGNTDYRRPADAVVVFGARAYADGRLSDALRDRIRTGCELYEAGLAKRLVLSGGAGDGAISEASAMRRYALSHGVPDRDIVVDDQGVNTEATVRDTVPLFRQWHTGRVLVVSHFYHLPRIKLAYRRAGIDVYTVPARQEHLLGQIPFNLAREVVAFWSYYLKAQPVASVAVPARG
jgi:uncharacterized SAM-binding protein YcdF (DUF218 family)